MAEWECIGVHPWPQCVYGCGLTWSSSLQKMDLMFIANKNTLRWRHSDHAGVSNHQPHGCLLNRLFGRKSKKTLKLRVTGLCAGNSPGTGEFPAQMASYAENISIWWRHHDTMHSNQEETDTCVIVYIKWAQDHGYRPVCIRCSDADVFFILLKYGSVFTVKLFLDTGTKQHRKVMSTSDIAADHGEPFCDYLLGFHVFTGEGTNSAFRKINPLK